MKFFYVNDIQFVIDSGYMPQSFLDDIKAESRTPDGDKLYIEDANYNRAYNVITGYIEDRWDNYWDTLPLVRENIDIVYPYYDERRSYEELKYSLRSIEANFEASNINVWVIGDKPSWASNALNHIQKDRFFGDAYHTRKKSIDSSQKMLTAMNEPSMGNDVLIMNDDQFFVNPTPVEVFRHPGAFRPWTAAQLNAWVTEGSNWEYTRKISMKDFLRGSSETIAYDYSTHLPYLYDKTNFLAMASKFGIDLNHTYPDTPENINKGVYCPEVLYYNEYPFDDPPPPAFERIHIYDNFISDALIQRQLDKSFVLNTPRLQFNHAISRLSSMFPNKSAYER